VKLCYKNILETAGVTLAAGAEDPVYPLYRLYDRDIGLMFKTTAAVTTTIRIDQGATGNLAADRLLIPSGHNLAGMSLNILYSDNDSAYYPAVTAWTGAAGLIDKSWASMTHRYWAFVITSPASIPQIPELFLTQTYTWERTASRPSGPIDPVFNVERRVTLGGQPRYCINGDAKRQRIYPLTRAGETQKGNILLFNDVWAGCKPFWLYDHLDAWIFGELIEPIGLAETAYQNYPYRFNFLEVLPG